MQSGLNENKVRGVDAENVEIQVLWTVTVHSVCIGLGRREKTMSQDVSRQGGLPANILQWLHIVCRQSPTPPHGMKPFMIWPFTSSQFTSAQPQPSRASATLTLPWSGGWLNSWPSSLCTFHSSALFGRAIRSSPHPSISILATSNEDEKSPHFDKHS